jgi:WD40 repeat protein
MKLIQDIVYVAVNSRSVMASVDLQEKANFTRLSKLLVDKGTEALRNAFDTVHPPANLQAVLAANKTSLLKLKPRVINNPQWDLLFPPFGNPPDSKTFDVTLLTVLFRNICGLPSTGWGAMPPDTDRSIQANILRLKFLRNEIYAHVTSTQVDNATFESLWQKISQALVDLNIPQNDVDDLKTCSLGPEEEIYLETLKEWKSQEEESMKVLEVLTSIAEENRDGIKNLCQTALEQQSNIEAIQSSIMRLSQVSKDTNLESNCNKEDDENLLQKLAKHNFKGKIRSKGKFFLPGTREWLLEKVEQFAKSKEESRMLLLTAGPGFGKSVFAAKICENFKMKGKLAASHFCDFSNSNLRNPVMMLQSLASQMCENIAGFKEKLLDQLKRPHQVRSLKDAFRIYLQNPLDELDLEEPSLVVIDGLDESAADNRDEITNLIVDYFQDLPECIKFLVTSRPGISVAKLSGVQKINIDSNDANNNSDLELYLKACLPRLADRRLRRASVCEKLAKRKCEGSFLYAFYVQSELRKRDDLDKIPLYEIMEFVPKGLDSIYLAYFNRLEDELKAIMHGSLDVLRILEMLAVSEGFHLSEGFPLSFISRALGLSPDNRETRKIINKVNETVSCLLYVSDDLVTVFHKSVIDWLLAEGYKDHEYTVKVMDGKKSLWLICENVFEEIKKTVCSGHDLNLTNDVKYALDHGFDYLRACMMEESLFWSVDIVIIHVLLTIYPKSYDAEYILNLWVKIFQDSANISDKLRERLSWHVFEIDFLDNECALSRDAYYLQSVLTHSPGGYFSDNEKEIAESLLSKIPRFVEYNCNEVEVLPLAAWHNPGQSHISAVGLSYDKTMAAVGSFYEERMAFKSGTIHVISVPSLVEIYSSKYKPGSSCCSFAPDDSFVLFGKLETVLNIAERKEVPFFYGNKETFTSCAFSPNGKRLVTSNGSNTIKLWDVSRQSLLSSLCADVPVGRCSFSSTGLLIIGDSKYDIDVTSEDSDSDYKIQDGRFDPIDSFCVWNAITWQRSDERNIRDVKLKKPGVIQDKKCKRCFRPGFKKLNSSNLEMNVCAPFIFSEDEVMVWSTGIYNGVECSFSLKDNTLSVMESTHFTTLAAWDLFVHIFDENHHINYCKLTTIEDDLWLYADMKKLFVFRTSAPTHQQSSRLPRPTRVLSSSFSPDGVRLATCTSDGYINIWNVYTGQVEQRFKTNQGDSSFACWWSEKFLFVFDFFDRIPSLSKYQMDVNLKILFPQSQQVSLCHLLEEFVSLSAIVDFSEGLLILECGETEPVKALDVSKVGGPRMVTLPGIEPEMSITVSPGASFVFGVDKYMYYIWKRNAKEELDAYEIFFSERCETKDSCCFSNDSKVAVVVVAVVVVVVRRCSQFFERNNSRIFDLVTGDHKSVRFDFDLKFHSGTKLFCLNKDRVLVAQQRSLEFFDMDSGELLGSSLQRYLTRDSLKQLKLSPKETMMAFPKINGDMEFLRLRIPQDALLSSMKREAAGN